MIIRRLATTLYVVIFLLQTSIMSAQSFGKIIVKANEPLAQVQPTMWGVFFEDINFGADGGIYAELIKNRSFEFYRPFTGWEISPSRPEEGTLMILNQEDKSIANPRFVRVIKKAAVTLSITNEGFRGMGIKKNIRYDFSIKYRLPIEGLQLKLELLGTTGKVISTVTLMPSATTGTNWKKAAISMIASDTAMKGKFSINFEGSGTMDIDMVSLFPEDTWKKRPGGMRADMIQLLADMKPGFIRFPGGCIVEGFDLSNRYQWKKTIGPVDDRQLIINRWNTEFGQRPTPDYYQTFGLGFFEYFQLAEDIGAAPLPILNCGMACQFNTAELVPLDQLDPYVQDAIDLIEFANGDVNSKWGKVRAAMGHPASFNLTMLGIGNENWGPQYIERLQIFSKAIKAIYPEIKLINSAGPDPNGEKFNYLDGALRKMNADIIDEHYYSKPEWFLANATRYDNYPRNASKIFAGEFAAQSDRVVSTLNKNNLHTAIAEAAFMTGLERNADVVNLASYAPLFAHIDGWQWTPDLIWVNNLQAYGTPNYYVQKLYSLNKGTHTVSALVEGKPLTGQDSLYASAVIDKNKGELIIKIVNAGNLAKSKTVSLEGIKKLPATMQLTVLKAANLDAVNDFANPTNIAPVETMVPLKGKAIEFTAAPYSFSLIRVKM